jgi:hypothetical protein
MPIRQRQRAGDQVPGLIGEGDGVPSLRPLQRHRDSLSKAAVDGFRQD